MIKWEASHSPISGPTKWKAYRAQNTASTDQLQPIHTDNIEKSVQPLLKQDAPETEHLYGMLDNLHMRAVCQQWTEANNEPFHLPKRCWLPFVTGVTSSTERSYIGALVICDFRWQRSVSSLKKKQRKRRHFQTFFFFACSHFIQVF